jgi:predicted porin
MNKKLLIAAVGAALVAGPMMAAQAAPTVYGHFHVSLDRYDVDTSATATTERGLLNSNSSRFGLKGDEDLGGGLKAIYQVESGVFAVDDGTSGFGNTLRNTYVGFSGSSWGMVKFGRHDTPVKDLGRAIDQYNEQIGDARNITGNAGAFDARINNMVRYDSPSFSGVKFALQYGTPEAVNSTRYTSGSVTWTGGPFMAGLGYEKHSFGGALVSGSQKKDESDIRLVGKYSAGDLSLALLYETMSDLGGVSSADRKVLGLEAGFKMANNMLKAHYYNADKVDGQATQNGGKIWALGVDHSFSKTTSAYVNYAVASNDSGTTAFNVSSANGGHGTTNVPTVGKNGGDSKAYSFGTIINF